MDFRAIDWDQDKPDAADLETGWSRVEIRSLDASEDGLVDLIAAFGKTHVNGGARIARFAVTTSPVWAWYLSRNRLEEAEFFRRFFGHPVVSDALKLGEPRPTDGDLGFEMCGPHIAIGHLATSLHYGGAYHDFDGSDAELLVLIDGFSRAAFENRYSDVTAFKSYSAWAAWFEGIAWDMSLVLFDKLNGVLTVVLITDAD